MLFIGLYGLIYITGEGSSNVVRFSGGYDVGFVIAASYILINHLIAFSILPLRALRKEITEESRTIFIRFAVITILMQLLIRLFSIGLSHLDCTNKCADNIIPLWLDYHLLGYTALGLVVTFVLILKAFDRRLNAAKSLR